MSSISYIFIASHHLKSIIRGARSASMPIRAPLIKCHTKVDLNRRGIQSHAIPHVGETATMLWLGRAGVDAHQKLRFCRAYLMHGFKLWHVPFTAPSICPSQPYSLSGLGLVPLYGHRAPMTLIKNEVCSFHRRRYLPLSAGPLYSGHPSLRVLLGIS